MKVVRPGATVTSKVMMVEMEARRLNGGADGATACVHHVRVHSDADDVENVQAGIVEGVRDRAEHDGDQHADEADEQTEQVISVGAEKSAYGENDDHGTGHNHVGRRALMTVQQNDDQIDQMGQTVDQQNGGQNQDDPFENGSKVDLHFDSLIWVECKNQQVQRSNGVDR